tara:strand:+ start:3588 stop:4661 length:1074 start_codon:yes stop_codon:yes gene_type:complete
MYKIKFYLFKISFKYLLYCLSILLIIIIFFNFIELSRTLKEEDKHFNNFIYLSIIKIPTIINEVSPFAVIISTAFIFRYLINNNELISMRNLGFSIFDIFQPIVMGVFTFGLIILLFLNPFSSFLKSKYDNILKDNNNMYSINLSGESLWIKNKDYINKSLYYINIEKFDVKKSYAQNIKILETNKNFFINALSGEINNKLFYLSSVNYFDFINDIYSYKDKMVLKLNFSQENIIDSLIDYKNVPYYNYIQHTNNLKKFNLYSSEIGLYYLSEILKPFFIVMLSFVVMGFSAKFKRNENFFKILFFAVLVGFLFFIFSEFVNKFTVSFNLNFIYSYLIIFITPFLIGIYKVIQIEND